MLLLSSRKRMADENIFFEISMTLSSFFISIGISTHAARVSSTIPCYYFSFAFFRSCLLLLLLAHAYFAYHKHDIGTYACNFTMLSFFRVAYDLPRTDILSRLPITSLFIARKLCLQLIRIVNTYNVILSFYWRYFWDNSESFLVHTLIYLVDVKLE